ncbi:AAA family ATPase [Virgibacillus sp. JSM 102003]|uniref:ATP-binding protein n=1 Tax=Virgibacillus sp. JSM 102003 TaxID=1562108 RepID=UPI0035BFCB57
MQIRHATIYGFGKWVDDSIDFSNESFVCVYGENESGKSTLQHFILFMLFGLPPKKRAYFRPKTSGKMGGRLTLFDAEYGEFTIERIDGVQNGAAACFTADGQSYGEDWLQGRLNGMTQSTFQSIFSFSAADLINIRNMKEDELGEVLLGVGLTGSKNIYAIEKQLENKIGELFKPFGKKPEINQQLETLDDLFATLQSYQETEATYRDKKSNVSTISNTIERYREELKRAKEDLIRVEKKQHALPSMKAYQREVEHLTAFPEEIKFPENGVERFETLKEKLLPLKSELSVLQDNQAKYKEKKDMLLTSSYEHSVYENAEAIFRQKQDYIENKRELDKQDKSIKKLNIQIETELEQLNIGISPEDLTEINLPFHVEKAWNQLKNDKEQLKLTEEHIQDEYRQLKKNQDYLINQQSEITDSLLHENKINELTKRINDYQHQEYLKKAREETIEQQKNWKKVKEKKENRAKFWLAGSVVIAFLVVLLAIFQEQQTLFGVSALILAGGIMQQLVSRKSMREMESMLQNKEVISGQVTDEEKLEAEQLLEVNDQRKNELASLRDRLRSIDIELLQWEEKKNGLQQKKERINKMVISQHEKYPFLKQIEIMYWPEFFHTLKKLINLDRDKRQLRSQYDAIEKEMNNFHQQLSAFYQKRNWETNKTVEEKLEEIENLLTDHQNTVGLLKQYETWITENSDEQREMKQKMHIYEQEIAGLISFAGTETEDEFLKLAKQLEEKQKHQAELVHLTEQIARILPSKEEYQALLEQKDIQESELEVSHEQISEQIDILENEIDRMRQERADIDADLSNMESSESHSEVLHRYNMEQEQLEKLAEEWSVYKTAKEILIEAKRNYRDKYMGVVIEKTRAYFKVLTANKYKHIYAPEANRPFQVESLDGIRYEAQELSQGTIDQLYVALRLGISDVMSEKHRLPFIIDDAFVHFDMDRTKRIIEMLSDVATNQQIILFTCKRDVMDLTANTNVIKLKNSVRIN